MKLSIVVLAAGEGTRMRSALPKVLHRLGGKPLLAHVLNMARQLDVCDIHVVYGHKGDQVKAAIDRRDLVWVHQEKQLGTGHAVQMAVHDIPDSHIVLVLYGDIPLLRAETVHQLLHVVADHDLVLLTARLAEPYGYGRIVRDSNGQIDSIVEEKDATDSQRQINEINTGILAVRNDKLKKWLAQLDNDNAQGEYYLTDIIAMAVHDRSALCSLTIENVEEIMGVNSRAQLAALERCYQQRQAQRLMLAGASLADPARLDVRGDVQCGQDVSIDINVIFEGDVSIGSNVTIGANNVIRDSRLDDGVIIKENCVIEHARVGKHSVIGPFARLRPETVLEENVKVGNFVEVKKANVASGSKINHLSYVGDARIGCDVNIGAGTITCNYDGANKHQTIIGDRVFIGSDCQLIAPVEIGDDATIGAGSTITRDAPAGELTLSRSEQKTRSGWSRPKKKSQ